MRGIVLDAGSRGGNQELLTENDSPMMYGAVAPQAGEGLPAAHEGWDGKI